MLLNSSRKNSLGHITYTHSNTKSICMCCTCTCVCMHVYSQISNILIIISLLHTYLHTQTHTTIVMHVHILVSHQHSFRSSTVTHCEILAHYRYCLHSSYQWSYLLQRDDLIAGTWMFVNINSLLIVLYHVCIKLLCTQSLHTHKHNYVQS